MINRFKNLRNGHTRYLIIQNAVTTVPHVVRIRVHRKPTIVTGGIGGTKCVLPILSEGEVLDMEFWFNPFGVRFMVQHEPVNMLTHSGFCYGIYTTRRWANRAWDRYHYHPVLHRYNAAWADCITATGKQLIKDLQIPEHVLQSHLDTEYMEHQHQRIHEVATGEGLPPRPNWNDNRIFEECKDKIPFTYDKDMMRSALAANLPDQVHTRLSPNGQIPIIPSGE